MEINHLYIYGLRTINTSIKQGENFGRLRGSEPSVQSATLLFRFRDLIDLQNAGSRIN